MKSKLSVFVVLLSGLLAGCSPGMNADRYLTNMHEHMGNEGKPAPYVEGYVDGCSTGRRMAGDKKFSYRRNHARADRDALYGRGWQDGQIACRNEVITENLQNDQARAEKKGIFYTSVDEERNRRMEVERQKADSQLSEIWDELKK